MYEKNCLNHRFVAHVKETTHMAILQMHPSPKQEIMHVFQKVYLLDPYATIHTIHAQTLHTRGLQYFELLLSTVKGPSCVLVCKEYNAFISVLRLLCTESEINSFPCTLIGVKHFEKMLSPAAVSVLTQKPLQWNDVLEMTQPSSQAVESLNVYLKECEHVSKYEAVGE